MGNSGSSASGTSKAPMAQEEKDKLRSQISATDMAKLIKHFKELDTDSSGYLDADELYEGLKRMRVKGNADLPNNAANRKILRDRVRALMEVADTNQDGKISMEEFAVAYSSIKKMMKAGSTSNTMARWLGGAGTLAFYVGSALKSTQDRVGVGDPDEDKAKEILRNLEYAEKTRLQAQFDKYDADGNGTIERHELMTAVRELGVKANADAARNSDKDEELLKLRVDRIMEYADINDDGKLDFMEFVYAIKTLEKVAEDKISSCQNPGHYI